MIQINGNMLFRMKNFVIKSYGKEEFDKMLKDMPEDSRKVLSGIIISGKWYDMKIYEDLLQAVADVKGKEELFRLTVDLGKQQLRGLFGFISKLVSPQTVVNKAEGMWKTLHSQGRIEVADFTDDRILIKVHDFKFSDIHMLGATGYFKGLIEAVCQKEFNYTYRNTSEGEYEFEFTTANNPVVV